MVHKLMKQTNPVRAVPTPPPNDAVSEDLKRHVERVQGTPDCQLCDEHGYLDDDTKCWHATDQP
jgi:hypothetical protein